MKRTVSQRLLMQFAWITLLAGSFVPSPARAQIYYTNFGSLVSIVAPANHAVFYFPVDIPIFAYARDGFGVPSAVNFYAGTNRLGAGHLLSVTRCRLIVPLLDGVHRGAGQLGIHRLIHHRETEQIAPGRDDRAQQHRAFDARRLRARRIRRLGRRY